MDTRAWSRRVITPRGGNLLTKVSELIDPTTGKWDMELVNDMFWDEDAKLILQMPSRDKAVDFLAWHFDPKGVFSFKQAYKLKWALSETRGAQANGISHDAGNLDGDGEAKWKRLWNAMSWEGLAFHVAACAQHTGYYGYPMSKGNGY